MPDDPVEVELGFECAGVLRLSLAQVEAAELERSYLAGEHAPASLAADEGTAIVDLRRVIYIRRLPQTRPVSFRS